MVADLVYVSWGGTGRAASLRVALARAAENDRGLTYLAVLDDSTFADVDDRLLDLAVNELTWLLETQLDLIKAQTDLEGVDVRVIVRSGDVADAIAEVAQAMGADRSSGAEVLIGAPVPVSGHDSIADLVELLGQRVDLPVSLIES